jgi:transposase
MVRRILNDVGAKIARRPGERVKTDRRDALLLARTARAGELVNM